MFPISLASGRGLKVIKFPDDWLAPSEPSPLDKEVTRLKARVRELETEEPDLKADLSFGVTQPFQNRLVEPLTPDEQQRLWDHLRQQHPRQSQQTLGMGTLGLGYDSGYDDRHRAFLGTKLVDHVAGLHLMVQDYYAQIGLRLTIVNEGSVQAENLVVELRCTGGGLRERFRMHWLFGPPGPKVRNPLRHLHSLQFDHHNIRSIVRGRHEVYFEDPPEGDNLAEIHCADFRHGWTWEWDGIAHLDAGSDRFAVDVTLTASNMKGKRKQTFALPTPSVTARVADLVDPIMRNYLTPFPLHERFNEAMLNRDEDWLQYPTRDED